MFPAPAAPDVPAEHTASTLVWPRYEDCAQDGRLLPIGVPNHMAGIWQAMGRDATARASIREGVIPVMTRMTILCEEQPIRIDRQMESRSAMQVAHAVDAAGDIARVHMNLWTEVRGVPGRARSLEPDGDRVPAGRMFAEHTFTRLFAPPDKRKVVALPGGLGVPVARYDGNPPATAQTAPDGATWLDEHAVDATPVVFTLDQTDANQHVNSLVYMRVFLDAVQRRLAATGRPLAMASRAIDIAYRKPSFAGDTVFVALRLFSAADRVGAAGAVQGPDGKPRALVRAVLAR